MKTQTYLSLALSTFAALAAAAPYTVQGAKNVALEARRDTALGLKQAVPVERRAAADLLSVRDCEEEDDSSASTASSTLTKANKAKTSSASSSESTKTTAKSSSTKSSKSTKTTEASSTKTTEASSTKTTEASSTKTGSSKSTKTSSAESSGSKTSASSSTITSAASSNSSSSSSNSAASAGGSLPASSGTSTFAAAQTIAAGESFDGGMVMIDRGVSCTGQAEGGDSDAVFILEDGATLSNVIIGPNQIEGVHCFGACTLTNVWWSAVCEDAFTIKEQDAGETTTITGGGAFGADDKVLQHNGGGTLSVSGFTVDTFGKLYRSCGNCKTMYERHVIMDNISATDGSELAGINSNYGDTATFTNIVASGVDDICVEYEGNDTQEEPSEIGSGPSSYCIYSTSDITSS